MATQEEQFNVQDYVGSIQNNSKLPINPLDLTPEQQNALNDELSNIQDAKLAYNYNGLSKVADAALEVGKGAVQGITGLGGAMADTLNPLSYAVNGIKNATGADFTNPFEELAKYSYRAGNTVSGYIDDNLKSDTGKNYKQANAYGKNKRFKEIEELYNKKIEQIEKDKESGIVGDLGAFARETSASLAKLSSEIGTVATNLDQATVLDTVANIGGNLATGGVAGKGTNLLAKGASLFKGSGKTLERFASSPLGKKVMSVVTGERVKSAITGIGMSGVGAQATELHDTIVSANPKELFQTSPKFKEMLAEQGINANNIDQYPEEVAQIQQNLADQAYRYSQNVGSGLVGAVNFIFPGFNKAFNEGKGFRGLTKAKLVDTLIEPVSEAFEESAETVGDNLATQKFEDESRRWDKDVAESATLGFFGGGFGAPIAKGVATVGTALAKKGVDTVTGKKPSNTSNTEPEVTSEDINNASKADTTNATYDDVKRDLFGDDSSEPNTSTQNDSTATNTQDNTNTQPEAEASSTSSTEQSEGTTDTETNTSTDNTQTTDTTEPSNTTKSKVFDIGDIKDLTDNDVVTTNSESDANFAKVKEKWDQLPKEFQDDYSSNNTESVDRMTKLDQVKAYNLIVNGTYEEYQNARFGEKNEISRVVNGDPLIDLTEDEFNDLKNKYKPTVTEQTTNNTQTDNVEPSVETNTTNTEPEVNTKPTEPTKQEKYRQLAKSKLQLNDKEKETAKKLKIADKNPTKVELFKALSELAKDNPDNADLAKELHRVGMDVIAGLLAYKKSKQTEELDQKDVQVASAVSMVENNEAFQKMDKVASEELIDNLDVSETSDLNRPLEDSYDEKTDTLNVINTNKDTEEANQVSGTINSLFRAMSNGANLLNSYTNNKGIFSKDDSFNSNTGKISRLEKISQYTRQMKEAINRGTLVLSAEDSKKLEIISELADVQNYINSKAENKLNTSLDKDRSIAEITETQDIQEGMRLVQKMIRSKDIGDDTGYTEAEDELKELVKKKLQFVGNKIKAWKDYKDKHSINNDVEYSADNPESYGHNSTNNVYAEWNNKGNGDKVELKRYLTEAIKLNEMLNATRVFTDKVSVDLQSTPNKPKDVYMIPSKGSVGFEEYNNALGIDSASGKETFDAFMTAFNGEFNFLKDLMNSASKLTGWKKAYGEIVSQESDKLLTNKENIQRYKALIIKAIKKAREDLSNEANWNAYKILMHSLSTIGPVDRKLLPGKNYLTKTYPEIQEYVEQVNALNRYPNVEIKDEASRDYAIDLVNSFLEEKGFTARFTTDNEGLFVNSSQEELDQANAELANEDEGDLETVLSMFNKEYSDPSEFEQSISSPKPSTNEGANIVNPPKRNVEAEQDSSEGVQTLLNSTKNMGAIAEEGWYRYITRNLKAKFKRLKGRLLQEKRTVDTLFGSAGLFQDKDLVNGNPLVNLFRNLKLRNVKEQSTYLVKALEKYKADPSSANIIDIITNDLLSNSLLSDEEKRDIRSVLVENSQNITKIQKALEVQLKEALGDVNNLFDMARYDKTKPYLPFVVVDNTNGKDTLEINPIMTQALAVASIIGMYEHTNTLSVDPFADNNIWEDVPMDVKAELRDEYLNTKGVDTMAMSINSTFLDLLGAEINPDASDADIAPFTAIGNVAIACLAKAKIVEVKKVTSPNAVCSLNAEKFNKAAPKVTRVKFPSTSIKSFSEVNGKKVSGIFTDKLKRVFNVKEATSINLGSDGKAKAVKRTMAMCKSIMHTRGQKLSKRDIEACKAKAEDAYVPNTEMTKWLYNLGPVAVIDCIYPDSPFGVRAYESYTDVEDAPQELANTIQSAYDQMNSGFEYIQTLNNARTEAFKKMAKDNPKYQDALERLNKGKSLIDILTTDELFELDNVLGQHYPHGITKSGRFQDEGINTPVRNQIVRLCETNTRNTLTITNNQDSKEFKIFALACMQAFGDKIFNHPKESVESFKKILKGLQDNQRLMDLLKLSLTTTKPLSREDTVELLRGFKKLGDISYTTPVAIQGIMEIGKLLSNGSVDSRLYIEIDGKSCGPATQIGRFGWNLSLKDFKNAERGGINFFHVGSTEDIMATVDHLNKMIENESDQEVKDTLIAYRDELKNGKNGIFDKDIYAYMGELSKKWLDRVKGKVSEKSTERNIYNAIDRLMEYSNFGSISKASRFLMKKIGTPKTYGAGPSAEAKTIAHQLFNGIQANALKAVRYMNTVAGKNKNSKLTFQQLADYFCEANKIKLEDRKQFFKNMLYLTCFKMSVKDNNSRYNFDTYSYSATQDNSTLKNNIWFKLYKAYDADADQSLQMSMKEFSNSLKFSQQELQNATSSIQILITEPLNIGVSQEFPASAQRNVNAITAITNFFGLLNGYVVGLHYKGARIANKDKLSKSIEDNIFQQEMVKESLEANSIPYGEGTSQHYYCTNFNRDTSMNSEETSNTTVVKIGDINLYTKTTKAKFNNMSVAGQPGITQGSGDGDIMEGAVLGAKDKDMNMVSCFDGMNCSIHDLLNNNLGEITSDAINNSYKQNLSLQLLTGVKNCIKFLKKNEVLFDTNYGLGNEGNLQASQIKKGLASYLLNSIEALVSGKDFDGIDISDGLNIEPVMNRLKTGLADGKLSPEDIMNGLNALQNILSKTAKLHEAQNIALYGSYKAGNKGDPLKPESERNDDGFPFANHNFDNIGYGVTGSTEEAKRMYEDDFGSSDWYYNKKDNKLVNDPTMANNAGFVKVSSKKDWNCIPSSAKDTYIRKRRKDVLNNLNDLCDTSVFEPEPIEGDYNQIEESTKFSKKSSLSGMKVTALITAVREALNGTKGDKNADPELKKKSSNLIAGFTQMWDILVTGSKSEEFMDNVQILQLPAMTDIDQNNRTSLLERVKESLTEFNNANNKWSDEEFKKIVDRITELYHSGSIVEAFHIGENVLCISSNAPIEKVITGEPVDIMEQTSIITKVLHELTHMRSIRMVREALELRKKSEKELNNVQKAKVEFVNNLSKAGKLSTQMYINLIGATIKQAMNSINRAQDKNMYRTELTSLAQMLETIKNGSPSEKLDVIRKFNSFTYTHINTKGESKDNSLGEQLKVTYNRYVGSILGNDGATNELLDALNEISQMSLSGNEEACIQETLAWYAMSNAYQSIFKNEAILATASKGTVDDFINVMLDPDLNTYRNSITPTGSADLGINLSSFEPDREKAYKEAKDKYKAEKKNRRDKLTQDKEFADRQKQIDNIYEKYFKGEKQSDGKFKYAHDLDETEDLRKELFTLKKEHDELVKENDALFTRSKELYADFGSLDKASQQKIRETHNDYSNRMRANKAKTEGIKKRVNELIGEIRKESKRVRDEKRKEYNDLKNKQKAVIKNDGMLNSLFENVKNAMKIFRALRNSWNKLLRTIGILDSNGMYKNNTSAEFTMTSALRLFTNDDLLDPTDPNKESKPDDSSTEINAMLSSIWGNGRSPSKDKAKMILDFFNKIESDKALRATYRNALGLTDSIFRQNQSMLSTPEERDTYNAILGCLTYKLGSDKDRYVLTRFASQLLNKLNPRTDYDFIRPLWALKVDPRVKGDMLVALILSNKDLMTKYGDEELQLDKLTNIDSSIAKVINKLGDEVNKIVNPEEYSLTPNIALSTYMRSIFNDAETKEPGIVNKALDKGDEVTGKILGSTIALSIKGITKINTDVGEFLQSIYDAVKRTKDNLDTDIFSMIKNIPYDTKINNKYIKGLVTLITKELSNTTKEFSNYATIKKLAKNRIQQRAEMARTDIARNIREILGDVDHKEATKFFIKSGMYNALLPFKTLQSIMNDKEELKKQIQSINLDSSTKAQIRSLVNYVQNGVIDNNFFARNTYAIATMSGSNIRDVRNYYTLISIKELIRKGEIDSIKDMLNSEGAGEKYMYILSILKKQHESDMSRLMEAHKNSQQYNIDPLMNYIEGSTPTVKKGPHQIAVTMDNDKAEEYKRLGYKLIKTSKNGLMYFETKTASNASFTSGSIQIVSPTAYGINLINNTDGNVIVGKAGLDMNNVDGEYVIPLYLKGTDRVTYELIPDRETLQVNTEASLPEVMGDWVARNIMEDNLSSANRLVINSLKDLYDKSMRKDDRFINIASLFTKNGDKYLLNPKLAHDAGIAHYQHKALTRLMNNQLVREQIFSVFGEDQFFVHKDLIDDAIGMQTASVEDLITGNNEFPKVIKTGLAFAGQLVGINNLRLLENELKGLTKVVKNNIVVKSVTVPVCNAIANVIQLAMSGVPLSKILTAGAKVKECNRYVELLHELATLDTKNASMGSDISARRLAIRQEISKMSIFPMIKQGHFNTIQDGIYKNDNESSNSYFEQAIEYISNNTIGKVAMINKDSTFYRSMERLTQYGDFVAKSIIYDHIKETKGEKEAIHRANTDFVDYDYMPSRGRDYLERIGFMWFFNYKLRMTKIAIRMAIENPFRSLLWCLVPHYMFNMDLDTVFKDSMIGNITHGKSVLNSMGFGNLFQIKDLIPFVGLVDLF